MTKIVVLHRMLSGSGVPMLSVGLSAEIGADF